MFWWLLVFSLWRYMKNQLKTRSEGIFSSREIHYLDPLWYSFSYRKYMGKAFISVIAGRTQTRISWARNWIFILCKKRLLRIGKLFHINLTCIFLPQTPYPLIFQKKAKTIISIPKISKILPNYLEDFPDFKLQFSKRRQE